LQDANRNPGDFGEGCEEGWVGKAMVVSNAGRGNRALVEHSPSSSGQDHGVVFGPLPTESKPHRRHQRRGQPDRDERPA
jgi:hypothetical protein